MQVINKSFNVYKFYELSAEAKQTAIESYRNDEFYPYDEWYDFLKSDFHEILELIGFYNIESSFCGFYSQGDGASFIADYAYKAGCLKAIKNYAPKDTELHSIVKGIISHQKDNGYKLECSITHSGSLYSHSNTMCFDWSKNGDSYFDWHNNFVESEIEQLIKDLADWYYSKLYNEYEYLMSNECIIENIEANDYDFYESGKQYF